LAAQLPSTPVKAHGQVSGGFPEEAEEIMNVINFLVEKKATFQMSALPENFIHSQVRKGQGKQKIFMKLLDRGAQRYH
jgi:SOS response regulatory protein OraA/RecX